MRSRSSIASDIQTIIGVLLQPAWRKCLWADEVSALLTAMDRINGVLETISNRRGSEGPHVRLMGRKDRRKTVGRFGRVWQGIELPGRKYIHPQLKVGSFCLAHRATSQELVKIGGYVICLLDCLEKRGQPVLDLPIGLVDGLRLDLEAAGAAIKLGGSLV